MANVLGMAAGKINGIFRVDIKGLRWRVQRPVNQNVTQGGVKKSKGVFLVSGSMDEVIPKSGICDWSILDDFSLQVYDYETRNILLFAAEGCDVESIDGSSDLAAATAGKSISWKGTLVTAV